MGSLLQQIPISLHTAFAASWLTVWFALRRFQAEKWWEKKFASYTAIFGALHDMSVGFDEEIDALERGSELSPDQSRANSEKYLTGRNELYKQIDIG